MHLVSFDVMGMPRSWASLSCTILVFQAPLLFHFAWMQAVAFIMCMSACHMGVAESPDCSRSTANFSVCTIWMLCFADCTLVCPELVALQQFYEVKMNLLCNFLSAYRPQKDKYSGSARIVTVEFAVLYPTDLISFCSTEHCFY
uniref:Putative secreted protein n=1 Tax=Amblyomma cajennense TaxID=34607 RepID=A0A023FE42_AMBCJ